MSDNDLKIAPWRLQTGEVLGEGSFGIVYHGTWTRGSNNSWTEEVAIKILKDPGLIDQALVEVKRMSRLDHPNIVKCFGISYPNEDESPWIVMERMPGGDLLSYIQNYPGGGMSAEVMIKLAYEIAKGMKYLHHDAGLPIRHCDLAARNCLVGTDNTVKIGDFGKFDYNYEDSYFDYDEGQNLPCPLRWMPPENIPTWDDNVPKFTRKGDVWAYGVVLFEIWTRGSLPFDGLNNSEVKEALSMGETPKDHRDVHAKWYILEIMDDCWEFNAQDRPNFKKIVNDIEDCAGHLLDN